MRQRTKNGDDDDDNDYKGDIDPPAYILPLQLFEHSVCAPVKLIGILLQFIGLIHHVVNLSTSLLCSLYIVSHNVDGVVDLLVERPVSIVITGCTLV